MGYAHIIWVLEDGIRDVEQHPEDTKKYTQEVGTGVLTLCLDPVMKQTLKGLRPVTHAPVLNHANCLNHAGALHSSDEEILIWAGGCLRTLDQMPDDRLEGVKRLFDARYEERQTTKHS